MAQLESPVDNLLQHPMSWPTTGPWKGKGLTWDELDRIDWHLWVLAVLLMLVLGIALLSFMFPMAFWFGEELPVRAPQRAVLGFCVLLSLALAYMIEREVIVRRLKRQLFHAVAAVYEAEIRATTQVFLGLPNIEEFRDMLAMGLRRASTSNEPLGVLLLAAGDPAEAQMGHAACLLIGMLRHGQTLFRVSPNSLAVILPGVALSSTKSLAAKALELLTKQMPDRSVTVISSVYPDEASTLFEMEHRLKLWAPQAPQSGTAQGPSG